MDTNKRLQMPTTTSINNMRTHFNNLLQNLDTTGYVNLLSNGRTTAQLKWGVDDVMLAKWHNPDSSGTNQQYPPNTSGHLWSYDGIKEVDDKYEFVVSGDSGGNSHYFRIKGVDTTISQYINYSSAERHSNNGIMTISVYYWKGVGTDDMEIKIENVSDSAVVTPISGTLVELKSEDISPNSINLAGWYLGGTTTYGVLRKTTAIYNVGYDVGNKRISVICKDSEWKILQNVQSYWGNIDGGSFVQDNSSDDNGHIFYDEEIGDYFISTDGLDKVSISTGKYFLTLGDESGTIRAQFKTLNEAIASIVSVSGSVGDNSSYGDQRIIFLTGNSELTADIDIPSGIHIMGNGKTIYTKEFRITINSGNNITMTNLKLSSDAVDSGSPATPYAQVLNISGGTGYCTNLLFDNCIFEYDGDHSDTPFESPLVRVNYVADGDLEGGDSVSYCRFKNCQLIGGRGLGGTYPTTRATSVKGFRHRNLITICSKYCDYDFVKFKNYGYWNSTEEELSGNGMVLVGYTKGNTQLNHINIRILSLLAGVCFPDATPDDSDLIGVYLGDKVYTNTINIDGFYTTASS